MSEKTKYETGFGSDATKNPQRVVFITKKTSAKIKGDVEPRVMAYPKLVLREVIAFQILTVVLVLISVFWDAPLEQLANPQLTPNPAKAPWYFLGLQELLHYFPPIVAGVLIPGLVIVALVVIPYFNVNIEGAPLWERNPRKQMARFTAAVGALLIFFGIYRAWTLIIPTVLVAGTAVATFYASPGRDRLTNYLRQRPLSWWVMSWFIIVATILTSVGTFFRGPGWSWVWPWR